VFSESLLHLSERMENACDPSKEARGLMGYGPVAMPRYFFVVTYADHQIGDPDPTPLPADTAPIEYAHRIMNDLREERRQRNRSRASP
jgi:hypothetical protein